MATTTTVDRIVWWNTPPKRTIQFLNRLSLAVNRFSQDYNVHTTSSRWIKWNELNRKWNAMITRNVRDFKMSAPFNRRLDGVSDEWLALCCCFAVDTHIWQMYSNFFLLLSACTSFLFSFLHISRFVLVSLQRLINTNHIIQFIISLSSTNGPYR